MLVQCAHLVALSGIVLRQYGQVFVVISFTSLSFLFALVRVFTTTNKTREIIMKLIIEVKISP